MANDLHRYLVTRAASRDEARQNFLVTDPEFSNLLDDMDAYVAHLVYELSGKATVVDNAGENLPYLLVTFFRGHFNISDFIRFGELTDAAPLFRRQMEILARMHEFRASADVEVLRGRTPNVKNLKSELRKLYGDYSAVAHGSDSKYQYLLGRTFEKRHDRMLPMFPHFSHHAYVNVGHVCLSIVELHHWLQCHSFDLGWGLDDAWIDEWWSATAPKMVRVLNHDPYRTDTD